MKNTVIAIALAAFAPALWAQDSAMKEEAGIRWACGGVGAEERAALASLRPQANLEFLFVTARRGAYLADVAVSLYAADGTSPRLELTSEGPICLLFAPAGRYRIEASFRDVKRTGQATAGGTSGKPGRVVFAFPEEPWDGLRASDEEKQQAKTQ